MDGADDPVQIADLIPTGPGHVLITSRNSNWDEHNIQLLEVPVFDRAESSAFLQQRAPRLTSTEASRLSEAVEDLPLLLDQTAGWLNDSELSVAEYLSLLQRRIDQDTVKVSADFPLAFPTLWSMQLNRLRDTLPDAALLLQVCAFFAPGSIPVRFVEGIPLEQLTELAAGPVESPSSWNKAINQLRQLSIIRLDSRPSVSNDAGDTGQYLSLHRMVHQAVREAVPDEERRKFIDATRQALAAADPKRPTDTRQWARYAELVPQLKCADVVTSNHPDVQRLVFNCLEYMYLAGAYPAGVELGQHATERWRALLGGTHPRFFELTYHYGRLLRASGEYRRTESMDREAFEHLRRERSAEDLEYLRAASGLAADLRDLGRYDEALEMTEVLLAAYHRVLVLRSSKWVWTAGRQGAHDAWWRTVPCICLCTRVRRVIRTRSARSASWPALVMPPLIGSCEPA
ncbi:FxSxx-COOH system tetratricopeptide repeat protein [Streptomyces sp. CA-106131]|uniref:FxSxx-COOH system tetratricopeptide repeat protein n=1 Tax=Streptomyces sp. CA-106131 TaxID=3240045 RepID=UPI003D924F90